MKKNNSILIGILFLLLIVSIFFFVSNKNINSKDSLKDKINIENETNGIDLVVNKTGTGGIEFDNKEENIEQTSEEIAKEMEILINSFESKVIRGEGKEGKLYKGLQEDYFENLRKKKDISNMKNYIKEDENIKKLLEIAAFDFEEKTPIEGANVYLWGLWVGQTNKDGILNKEISLPRELSFYYIHIDKIGYIGGFKYIDNILEDKKVLNQYIEIKKTISKKSVYNNIDIKNDKFKIILTGECNFETDEGKCYSGDINVNIGYISGNEADELGFPMRALTIDKKGTFDLTSAGMDFTDFYDKNGNKLIYTKQNRIKICHYISYEKQKEVEEHIKEKTKSGEYIEYGDIWNYRWFNKSKGIWIAGIDAIKTIDGFYQCYETFNL